MHLPLPLLLTSTLALLTAAAPTPAESSKRNDPVDPLDLKGTIKEGLNAVTGLVGVEVAHKREIENNAEKRFLNGLPLIGDLSV
ncbi:hypothetical protein P168DRAFT_314682 [Aspergillus campestris IBT 28561]|uniref:Uncharacterized protein n=1 Tax=Aspergillus campestris (strain IBT 28561) TaxID=1392248 RepID=A0A2I1DFH6_ASPC2|nr:uncharacterized protein P168DRAFT_314682 [Aspergillus campestris IBT 28561]PKY08610.1 hypothetical protein P168DRAFT_314682 [Aspergillus campestris IBT 28561]